MNCLSNQIRQGSEFTFQVYTKGTRQKEPELITKKFEMVDEGIEVNRLKSSNHINLIKNIKNLRLKKTHKVLIADDTIYNITGLEVECSHQLAYGKRKN